MATSTVEPEVEAAKPDTQAKPGMDITIERDALLSELDAVIGVVGRKTTIPIFSSVLLRASGDVLEIAATDLDTSIRAKCAAKVMADGQCAAPGHKLYDYVKALPAGAIHLKQSENGWLNIRSGRSKTKMVGLPAANFPLLPEMPSESAIMPASVLAGGIARTLLSVSTDDSRPTLKAAFLKVSSGKMEMVATDGHRLALASHDLAEFPNTKALIPLKALKELKSMLSDCPGDSSVLFAETAETLFFVIEGRMIASRKLTGQFPNYELAIPKPDNAGIVLDPQDVAESLRRCLLFSDARTGSLRFSLSESSMRISSAAADIGETEESIEIYGGPEKWFDVGFNGEYIADLLNIATGPVTAQFGGASTAALLTHASEDGFLLRYIVMPMRISGEKS